MMKKAKAVKKKVVRKPVVLSSEQQLFISTAKEGKNILVDACIGSGKTTAIQRLCDELPSDLNILYLTYSKLLKLDAKKKIKNKNVTVTNYHGFAWKKLDEIGISTAQKQLVQRFNEEKPPLECFDVLVIDEYQDIYQEISEMLEYIKSTNIKMQIIAVGDMEQKINDKTALNVAEFIEGFLGKHTKLEFTQCFRLSADLAAKLGRIWQKNIVGVNNNCKVEEMTIEEVENFLSEQSPKDILCLGANKGYRSVILNHLEEKYPEKFNKKTVYSKISDNDSAGATGPSSSSAIFTTFDGSKGLERRICVVFDYTISYWKSRINHAGTKYEILRNIFCVAASRGKERIIFVNSGESILSEEILSTATEISRAFQDVNISAMFDFKYEEDIEKCYSLLDISPLTKLEELSEIDVNNRDGLIDLSPCIGIYQEAVFFRDYDIDKRIELWFGLNKNKKRLYDEIKQEISLDEKILMLVALETCQNRYFEQVERPFVSDSARKNIIERLSGVFTVDEEVQSSCSIDFINEESGEVLFSARGIADVIKEDVVYELKFVSALAHEHFLQCASYVVALELEKGILWNVKNNECYEIRIPDREKYLNAVAKTVTKRIYSIKIGGRVGRRTCTK